MDLLWVDRATGLPSKEVGNSTVRSGSNGYLYVGQSRLATRLRMDAAMAPLPQKGRRTALGQFPANLLGDYKITL